MSSIIRHEIYYFEDGNLVLLAETTLFKVHKSLFMFSPFFQEMLSLPQSEDNPLPQGSSDLNPIDIGAGDIPAELGLTSITAEDFSEFLSVILPMTYQGDLVRSAESWGRVLKTSTMLQFERIRVMAIMNILPTADPLLMIELGSDHHHEPFIVEGIKRMSIFPRPIPFDAALALNPLTFHHLTSSREAIRTHLARKVMGNAFNWECAPRTIKAYGGFPQPPPQPSKCIPSIQTQLSNLIFPQSAASTTFTDGTKAFHHIAKETLTGSKQLCDSCLKTWDSQIEKLVDFGRIDEIIKVTIREIPSTTYRRLKNRRFGGHTD